MLRFNLLVSVATVFCAVPSTAAVNYHYSGQINPINTRAVDGVTYVAANAPITFDFTIDSPLAANLDHFYVTNTLDWAASAGSPGSTITNAVAAAFLTRLYLNTDSTGTITKWNISAVGTPAVLAESKKQLEFYFDSYDSYMSIPVFSDVITYYNGKYRGGILGAVNCTNCGTRGAFSRTELVASVPEPETWALMIVGFGVMGVSMRRRRRTAKVAFAYAR